jgi:uncharacterized membrane protein
MQGRKNSVTGVGRGGGCGSVTIEVQIKDTSITVSAKGAGVVQTFFLRKI